MHILSLSVCYNVNKNGQTVYFQPCLQGRIKDREHELSERMRRWLWEDTAYEYSLYLYAILFM